MYELANKRSFPLDHYLERIDANQKQWAVMRYVSFASTILCCYGIFLDTRNTEKRLRGIG